MTGIDLAVVVGIFMVSAVMLGVAVWVLIVPEFPLRGRAWTKRQRILASAALAIWGTGHAVQAVGYLLDSLAVRTVGVVIVVVGLAVFVCVMLVQLRRQRHFGQHG
jgi:hypothetical protein